MCGKRLTDQGGLAVADLTEERRGFAGHALTFALVIGGLALLNLATSPEYLWFLWPLLCWGIGLVSHGLSIARAGDTTPQFNTPREAPPPPPATGSEREWPDLES